MLQGEQAELSATAYGSTTLVELEGNSYRPSMLYSVLPTLVSNHIPTISSLRQSLSDVRNRGAHNKSSSVIEIPQPETPPPSYSSTPQSGSATPNRLSVALEEADLDFSDDVSERPVSSSSAHAPLFDAHEASTGIRWKYATLGTRSNRRHWELHSQLQAQVSWLKQPENPVHRMAVPTIHPRYSSVNYTSTASPTSSEGSQRS